MSEFEKQETLGRKFKLNDMGERERHPELNVNPCLG